MKPSAPADKSSKNKTESPEIYLEKTDNEKYKNPVFLWFLATFVAGCRTPRPLVKNVHGDTLALETACAQAAKALEEGAFVLVPEEFYFPARKQLVRYASGSFLSMKDNTIQLYVPWDLFRGSSFEHFGTYENPAQITQHAPAKNGDLRFCIKTRSSKDREYRIEIMLYKDTDRCFAILYDHTKGHLLPIYEEKSDRWLPEQ